MATFYVLITAYPFPSLCTFIPLPRHFALCGNVLFALHLISLCRTRTTLESRAKLLLNRTVRNRKRFFLLSEKKTMVVFMCRYQSRTAVSLCMDNLYRRQRSIKTALTCHFPTLRWFLIYILYLLSQCWSDSTISLHNCYICYATLMLISSPIVCSEGYCCWIVWRRYREMLTRTREGNEIWKKFAFWNKASKKGDLRLRWKLYASYERDFSLINLYISEHQLQSVRINYRLSLIEKLCCPYFLVASSCLYY